MICVSLGNMGFSQCVESLLEFDCAEIRLDLMELTENEVKLLFSEPCTLVATCRPGKYIDEERLSMLTCAIHYGAQYVDIEIESDISLIHKIKQEAEDKGVKLIISYHNFNETPTIEELENIIQKSHNLGADIVKIATTAHNSSDCANVLSLYSRHNNIIAFCMGRAGIITRVAAPYLGAEFTFAAYDESQATAPGQLTVEKMEKINEILHVRELRYQK